MRGPGVVMLGEEKNNKKYKNTLFGNIKSMDFLSGTKEFLI